LVVARAQRDEAQRAADKATAVRQFFLEVLTSPAPQVAGREVTVVDALRRAQHAVAQAFPDQPELRGDVHAEMAATFARLGESAEAEAHARHALRIRTQTLGESHRDTIRSMNDLANILSGYERVQHAGAREEADRLLDRAIELLRREHADHPDALIDLLSNKAALMFSAQRLDEAERLARETLELSRAHLGETHTSTILQRQNLAMVLAKRDLNDQAEPEFRRVVELLTQVIGPKHPSTLGAQRALAGFLRGIKRYDEAEAIYRDTLPIVSDVMGASHSETVIWHNELAFCLKKQSKYPEAVDEYRAALQAARSMDGGGESYLVIGIADSLAITLSVMGEHAQAEPLYREAMLGLERLHGPAADTTLYETCKLANALLELGRHEEALTLANDRLALVAANEDTDPPAAQSIALLRIAAARSMHAAGRREETISLLDQCVRECAALESKGGRDHYLMPAALVALAECCEVVGRSSHAATVRGWLETDRGGAADEADSAVR
jgi:tetratricopeptide (TPR) repeat protein